MKLPKHKHELKEDKLVTTAFLVSEFAKTHWKKLLEGAIGVVAIIIIIISINMHQKSVANQALRQYDTAMSYFSNKNFEKAEEEFKDLAENYGSAKEHRWAYFYLGKIYLEKDSVDYEQAENYFSIASSKIKNNILKEAAMIGLAKCYLEQGNEEEYFSTLEKITQKFPGSFNTPELLFEIAEHYYEKSEPVKAKRYYQKIVDNYKASSVYYKAKNKLKEI
jgi:TolA-binding protein